MIILPAAIPRTREEEDGEEEKHLRSARVRSNQQNQHRSRYVRQGGASVRHAQDGQEDNPKIEGSVRFSSVRPRIAKDLPKEIHRHRDEQTSVAHSGA